MATVGTISAIFSSDTAGLKKGIDNSVAYFQKLQKEIEDVVEVLEEFTDEVKKQAQAASDALSGLNTTATLTVDADTSQARRGIAEIEQSIERVNQASPTIDVAVNAAPAAAAVESVSVAVGQMDTSLAAVSEGAAPAAAQATDQVAASAERARTSLASMVIGAGRVVSVTSTAVAAYRSFREALLGNISAITGARDSAQAYAIVQSALRGNAAATSIVLNAMGNTFMQMTRNLFSAEGALLALETGLSRVLQAVGVSDEGLREAIQTLSRYTLEQISSASTSTLAQKSVELLSQAYEGAATRLGNWFVNSERAVAVTERLGQALDFVVTTINNRLTSAEEVLGRYLARFDVTQRVSNITAAAFDRVVGAVNRVVRAASDSTTVLGKITNALAEVGSIVRSAFGAVGTAVGNAGRRILSLIPSLEQVRTSIGHLLETTTHYMHILGGLWESFNFVRAAMHANSEEFIHLIGHLIATEAAIGGVLGALSALVAGESMLAGAATGAASSIAGFSAFFPTMIGLGTLAAATTEEITHELQELSIAFQKTDQMASRFGATTQEMQKLELAAANTAVGMGQLGKAQQSFFSNLSKIRGGQLNVENVREAKLAFDRLGISVEDIKEKNPREIFAEVAEKVSEIEDPADRAAAAFDLFGKQGAAILPALKEFGELEDDFARVGGAVASLDFSRLLAVETSFDRLEASAKALEGAMLLPFAESKKGLNNFTAEVVGGLVPAMASIGSLFADMSRPFAAMLEVLGRLFNIAGRIVGVFVSLTATLSYASSWAVAFDGLQQGIFDVLKPLETVIGVIEEITAAIVEFMRPSIDGFGMLFQIIGRGVGVLLGFAAVTVGIAAGAAASWLVYTLAVNTATAAMVRFAVQAVITWIAALGPLGIAIALMVGVGAAMYALVQYAEPLARLFTRIGAALGFVGKEAEKIDAAKASVQELAETASAAGAGDVRELAASISQSRGEIDDLIISSAKYGQAGSEAASAAQKQFKKLQQELADGKLTAEEFDEAVAKNAQNLEDNLSALKNDSPEITLKKNLELYKSLDDAVKSAGKSVRDLAAGTVVNDKLFPTSEAIKAAAETYKNEYSKAIEEIKKKQQSGGFTEQLANQAKELEDQLASGSIGQDEYEMKKMGLDSTSAQEEAQKAAEDVKRTFDRQMEQIGKDTSFATDIRKQLEDAFLSPVEKFEKKLKEINDNKSLTPEEKALAEKNLRKETKQQLVGQSASEKFQDRQRDLLQASRTKLIEPGQMANEMLKNSNELASALGIAVNPARTMEVALYSLDEALNKGAINANDYADGVKNAKDKFLESLGIERSQSEKDNERLSNLQQQFDAGKITAAQFEKGKQGLSNEVFGKSQAQQFADQEERIRNAIANGTDDGRGGAALRKLSMDKMNSVGLTASPEARLQAQIDKIDDAFGVTGMNAKDAAAKLRQVPGATEAYRRAVEKAGKSLIDSLGVNKTPMETFTSNLESISEKFGVTGKTVEESRNQLRGNAQALKLFDRAIKDSRDSLLQSLGVEKSPQEVFEESMRKIQEAAATPGGLTAQEAAKASAETMRKRDEALGGESTSGFVNEYARKKNAIEQAFGVGGSKDKEKYDNALRNLNKGLPGMDKESPVAEFQRNLERLSAVFGENSKEFKEGKLNLQAQLQEELRPLAGSLAPERRGIESADARSKAGVDTFFRILRGRDDPSLKAQLDTARNTKILADAAANANAKPLLVQLNPR